MNKFLLISALLATCAFSCKKKQDTTADAPTTVSKDGTQISVEDTTIAKFFQTEPATHKLIEADITAPAQVVADVMSSRVILFSDPELTSNYTELLNHQSAIAQKEAVVKQKTAVIAQKDAVVKQKQIEIERFTDLAAHGAATGKDLADVKTDKLLAESEKSIAQSEKAAAEADLIAERSLIIEHTSKLEAAGFNPQTLLSAPVGNIWVIADIPENQIDKIKTGANCIIKFTAYPDEVFQGTVNGISEVMDNMSHMTKVRIILKNQNSKFRAGMFGLVSFGIREGNYISVDKNALIAVQGKNYVFVQKDKLNYERRSVQIGQQIGDRIIVFDGLKDGEKVVKTGAIELKGLSFGY